jgi:adenosylmethionine-8-amino-7-oxononanoate aminotransferase
LRGSIASLELLQTSEMQANIVRVNQSFEFEKRVKNHPQVVTTRESFCFRN